MNEFLRGAVALGCAATGLYFFRFWRQSLDRLFLCFALAFWILTADYTFVAALDRGSDWFLPVFAVRLLAYGVILFGILDKNRR